MTEHSSTISSFSVIVLFVCLIVIGIGLIPLLPIQLLPSIQSNNLSITYSWQNVPAGVIEQEVTARLEGLFAASKGIKGISSVSSKGYGKIDLVFKKDVDRDVMRFEIASLLRQIYPALPAGVSYPELSMNLRGEKANPLIIFSINSTIDSHYIGKYIEKEITPVLSQIKGVNEVQIHGVIPYAVEIKIQTDIIRPLKITANDIVNAISLYFNREVLGRGNYDESVQHHTIEISSNAPADTLLWENIPIKKVSGRIVLLKDVATVSYEEHPPSSYYRVNGRNAVNIVIYPDEGINTIALAKVLLTKIQHLRQGLDPNYSITLASDGTEYLNSEIEKIIFRTSASLIILLTFVFAITRRLRHLIVITLSFLANFFVSSIAFYLLNIELQLYSLTGLSVAFGIIVGNFFIIAYHFRNTVSTRAHQSIVASTLSVIAGLAVVIFLQEEQKTNLIDFVYVIIVNITISTAVGIFLVPVLLQNVMPVQKHRTLRYKNKKRIILLIRIYGKSIIFNKKLTWIYIIVLVMSFGIPIHLFPDKITDDHEWAYVYNNSLGSRRFREEIKPTLEKVLGGSLRLFSKDVLAESYSSEPGKTMLYVNGRMPEGCTVQQMNEAIQQMEDFIAQFEEVDLFQTSVSSYKKSSIVIHFKAKHEQSSFPFFLKNLLEARAIDLGGTDWNIYGVGLGFSNAAYVGYKSNSIALEGYNYDQLYQYANLLKNNLLKNRRIREVDISGSNPDGHAAYHELFMKFNNERLAVIDVTPQDFYNAVKNQLYHAELKPVYANHEMHPVYVTSDKSETFNLWDFNHTPIETNKNSVKISGVGLVEKQRGENDINKHNQQYRLVVSYDFIGPAALGEKVEKRQIEALQEFLPLGYRARSNRIGEWNRDENTQYYFIIIATLAIYIIGAIFLESFLQPLAIIAVIPISFIGIFLTFSLFSLNFDQGGFTSFILLSGLSVSAALFIVNDYNHFTKETRDHRIKLYLKAFRYNIVPMIISTLSIGLSLIPFLAEGQSSVFWFAFSAGTVGGLSFCLLGILLYLPLLLRISDTTDSVRSVQKKYDYK